MSSRLPVLSIEALAHERRVLSMELLWTMAEEHQIEATKGTRR